MVPVAGGRNLGRGFARARGNPRASGPPPSPPAGELRIDGKRAQPNERLVAGQKVRVPPLKLDQQRPVSRSPAKDQDERDFLKSITLYEDKDVLIINKPMGLAVQGGSGTKRHV